MASRLAAKPKVDGHSEEALAVALQHPAVAAHQHSICTLLQVCKDWRAAVQQSAACVTEVCINGPVSADNLSRISNFAGWLCKHAQLISRLSINLCSGGGISRHSDAATAIAVSRQLIELSMHGAASAAAAGASAPRLRLQSLKSALPPTAGLLAALPAATLTRLKLSQLDDSSSWSASLSKLSSLQHVSMHMNCLRSATAAHCLRELGRLRQLTQLELTDVPGPSDMQLLPLQLRQLSLTYNESSGDNTAACGELVDLQHLTCLQRLQLSANTLKDGSSVPTSLQSLQVAAKWPSNGLLGITHMQQVTSIVLSRAFSGNHPVAISTGGGLLQNLRRLSQLKELSLELSPDEYLLVALPAIHDLRNLPLCALHIVGYHVTTPGLRQLVSFTAGTKGLTRLVIDIEVISTFDSWPEIEVCGQLKRLTGLQSLGLHISESTVFVANDAQHLTALTNLTQLDYGAGGSSPSIEAPILCLLASVLTRLRGLRLYERFEDLQREARVVSRLLPALPALAKLTTLEKLCMGGFAAEDAAQGLLCLTGLSRLTRLVGFEAAGAADLGAFWDAIESHWKS